MKYFKFYRLEMPTRNEGGRIQTVTHAGVRSPTAQMIVLGEPGHYVFAKVIT